MYDASKLKPIPLKPRTRKSKPIAHIQYAVDEHGVHTYAFDYSRGDWLARNKTGLHCPLCVEKEIPQSAVEFFNHKITKHFRHKVKIEDHPYETLWHMESKILISELLPNGVTNVKIEKTLNEGSSRADVYCEYKGNKFAFEVQYSTQRHKDYKDRTERYDNSGIQSQWIYHPECESINLGDGEIDLQNVILNDDKSKFGFIVVKKLYGELGLAVRGDSGQKYVLYTDRKQWHLGSHGFEPRQNTEAHSLLGYLRDVKSRIQKKNRDKERLRAIQEEIRKHRALDENKQKDPHDLIFHMPSDPRIKRTFPERQLWAHRMRVRICQDVLECKPLLEWLSVQPYVSIQHHQISMLIGFMYWAKHEISFTKNRTLSLVLDETEDAVELIMKDFYAESDIWSEVDVEINNYSNRSLRGTFRSILKVEILSKDKSFPLSAIRRPLEKGQKTPPLNEIGKLTFLPMWSDNKSSNP